MKPTRTFVLWVTEKPPCDSQLSESKIRPAGITHVAASAAPAASF
jgi:hypothetical protein